jgi:hypothetical protein
MTLIKILKKNTLALGTALIISILPNNSNLSDDLTKTRFFGAVESRAMTREEKENSFEIEKLKLKRAYDIVKKINSPQEAQDFISEDIKYSYQDLNEKYKKNYPIKFKERKKTFVNGADAQSFSETLERRGGKCLDGSIAFLALLQNKKDEYEPYLLTMTLKNNEPERKSHAIAIYKDKKTNLWGSGGLNNLDFKQNKYDNLEELIEDIASCYEKEKQNKRDYSIYDLNQVDLTKGTNNGLVYIEPFEILRKENGQYKLDRLEKEYFGFEQISNINDSVIKITLYDNNLNKVYTMDSKNKSILYDYNKIISVLLDYNNKNTIILDLLDKKI